MKRIIEELAGLQLDLLDDNWVENVYYSEFLEFGELDPSFERILESMDLETVFRRVIDAIDSWLGEECSDREKSWTSLSQEVQYKKIFATLAYIIDYGTKHVMNKDFRNKALLASRLYYKFMSISGFKAYSIYHSQMFTQSLACLGFPKALCDNDNKFYNNVELNREVNLIIKELRNYALDLKIVMETLQLNSSDMNFEDIISNLVDITGGNIVSKLNIDKIELANVTSIIYEMIDILLRDSMGEPNPEAILLLFKSVLPKLISATIDGRKTNSLVRASYVTYSGLILSKYRTAALPSYIILLEHLCHAHDGMERGEVRQSRVDLVMGLMSLLPRKSYRKFVSWLLKLVNAVKVVHRQFTIEMISNLLKNAPDREANAAVEQTADNSDVADNPQAITESESENQDPVKEKEDSVPQAEENPALAEVLATDGESSQKFGGLVRTENDQELTAEDFEGLLRQRVHVVKHSELLRALFDRTSDVSSTVRTRALMILSNTLRSDYSPIHQAIEELNGTGPVTCLMEIASRGVSDERAVVRRAALALLYRLLSQRDSLETAATDIAALVGLCRDASLMVRSAAIGALGDLVDLRPCDTVCNAFINGPMNQINDPEVKVQEQVAMQVQRLLIDRLEKYSAFSDEDQLPWMFLASVSQRQKVKQLQEACGLLSKKSHCISHRLVDILSTHLDVAGDEHDLHVLVLLTTVAKFVEYNDVGFVLDYYYKLANNPEGSNVLIMQLTLELLTNWQAWLKSAQSKALRNYLVNRLTSSIDDGCRIPTGTLASSLDPSNLNWATELMRLAERRALASNDVTEWLRAADMSLVAPERPSPAILQLFISSLRNPPPDWTPEEHGMVAAGCGRLCVRLEGATIEAAPVLAALMTDTTAPLPARMNAMLALTDGTNICLKILDRVLDFLCDCLSKSTLPPLRRQAVFSITKLLLSGSMRLRPPLFFRYFALLADEDQEIREPAEHYVTFCLSSTYISNHFIESITYYNREDTEQLTFDERQLIYDVMLQRLSSIHRVNVQCRLAKSVIMAAANAIDDGDGELPPMLTNMLLDTITFLCGPRMKLPKHTYQDTEYNEREQLQERITTNIVSQKMKDTVAGLLVPAVMHLYTRVRTQGGQVAAYVVRYANELLVDYRQEIQSLLDDDEELVERVRHFQETIGQQPSFGNTRNLVTSSTSHEPGTPRGTRKRAQRPARSPPSKRRA